MVSVCCQVCFLEGDNMVSVCCQVCFLEGDNMVSVCCQVCFLESVDKATLCCPLCRKRVSSWARLHSRTNSLVDQDLWTRIQTSFPLQCQRRLNGQDAEPDGPGVSVCFPRVSQPGELKQEYEEQVTKLTEERRALDEEESRASQELIQKLLAEEQKLLQEEMKRREEDERLARLLSSQLNSGPVSQENLGPVNAAPAKKRKKEVSGQMDRFLCPLPSNSMLTTNQVDRPLPKLDYYGAVTDPPPHRAAPLPLSVEEDLQLTGRPGSKRKSSELDTVWPPSSSSSSLGGAALQEMSEGAGPDWGLSEGAGPDWGVQLQSRRLQEEQDRQLALQLQKQLDQEEKRRATSRGPGSSDQYLLRPTLRRASRPPSASDPPNGASRPPSASHPPGRASRPPSDSDPPNGASGNSTPSSAKTTNCVKTTRSSSPSSPSSRGRKQTTLTELFSSS
uniref:RING-type E3 ubiquitin transferase n=1 Tax=Sander lucioperca TaxID=283035 RepID=A0A8C9ZQ77_SANLU